MDIFAPAFRTKTQPASIWKPFHWPEGPICPHCGSLNANRLPPQKGRKTKAHPEGMIRKGVVQCNDCRRQYTVTVSTVFERSKVPLNKWLLANHLLCASKKGISGHQMARMLGVTYRTAWFMMHRIREAMKDDGSEPLGGYARAGVFHSNTVEGFFSILKRGIVGVYHHVSEQHLKRYVTEFDLRYNTRKMDDFERADQSLLGAVGKRLTYRRIGSVAS